MFTVHIDQCHCQFRVICCNCLYFVSVDALQEDIAAKVSPPEGNEGEDGSSNEDSDSDSSSTTSSACRVQSEDGEVEEEKAKPPRRAKRKSEEEDKEKSKSDEEPEHPAPPPPPPKRQRGKSKDEAAAKATERIEAQLASARKVLQSLTELTPESLWRSLVRTNELDRRLGRAVSVTSDMQKVAAHAHATPDQKATAEKIEQQVKEASTVASAMKELCRWIRQTPLADIVTGLRKGCFDCELWTHLHICHKHLFKDWSIVVDIVITLAKKLLDSSDEVALIHCSIVVILSVIFPLVCSESVTVSEMPVTHPIRIYIILCI